MSGSDIVVVAVAFYLILVALLIGSFINMAADRLPRGESLIHPGSHCRACGRRLNMLDLIPVGGYLIRGGRCASCGVPIGAEAPIVEAMAGLAMAVPLLVLGLPRGALVGLALVVLLGAMAVSLAFARLDRRGRSRP